MYITSVHVLWRASRLNAVLPQYAIVGYCRRAFEKQVRACTSLGEGDHVPDGLRLTENRHEAVET